MSETMVECKTCKKRLKVSFAKCLRSGWPECHDETMRLITKPSEETIKEAVASQFRWVGLKPLGAAE